MKTDYSQNMRLYSCNRADLLFMLSGLYISALCSVIVAQSQHDFRCSHLPPRIEQASHVWLNANFSALEGGNEDEYIRDPFVVDEGINKAKRQATNELENFEPSLQDSIWNLFKKFESPMMPELIPMKIKVHYDNSVYLLEKPKLDLINGTVMPAVVKFFESVLSIKRELSIDKFRIQRRCPNNLIYYARDRLGMSRPYCMDRCEDYAICGEMVVPENHLAACSYCNSTSKRCTTNYTSEGKGVANAQLLLYVSAKQTNRCKKDQTIAYAAHCAQDSKTDRPVAGHANLCPLSISTDDKDLKALIATVKHELTHVLGFSVSLFAYYRDEYGKPLIERDSNPGPIPVDESTGYAKWSDKVIKKITRKGWSTGEGISDREIHMVVTPTVVREVRRHFNCSTLEGAELEDQGSDGTSMTHWEKRLFENEAMTGTHTQNSVYSRLTLAVLQDTGWYVANFSRAEKLDWGKDLGCEFAKKSCKSWIEKRRRKGLSIRPFCDRVKGELLQIACTEDLSSKAVCNMKRYKEPLPPIYQNFDYLDDVSDQNLKYFGGSVDLADYCPFIQEFTWQAHNVTVRGSRCDLIGNNLELERNAALEHYGLQTKCFEHGRRWEQRSCIYKRHWHHFGAGCYKYTCSDGIINVLVGNHSYPCFYSGQHISIETIVDQWLYNGTIICPACEQICQPSKCRSHDRKLIDKFLALNHHVEKLGNKSIDDIIFEFFQDEPEFAIKENELTALHSLETKQNFIDTQTNQSVTYEKFKEHRKYLEQFLLLHKTNAKHLLICSGAISFTLYLNTISMVTLITTSVVLIII